MQTILKLLAICNLLNTVVYACKKPESPEDGYYYPYKKNYTTDDIIFYGCSKGFQIHGKKMDVCNNGWMMEKKKAFCAPTWCSTPPIIQNGYIYPSLSKYGDSKNVFIGCDNGFKLIGAKFIKCVRGKWEKISQKCKAADCPTPKQKPEKGFFYPHKPYYNNGDKIYYGCDEGFQLFGSNSSKCEQFGWTSSDNLPKCISRKYVYPF